MLSFFAEKAFGFLTSSVAISLLAAGFLLLLRRASPSVLAISELNV
jgi:hypothetical protein